ncbi:MAG TPA: DUF4340 domain-containing protein [Terricaulis sp.]|nr:DUF4340 domain-containing protein [Terricaulis sp.]HRP11230.1 DUF4340 domain-containing protein [Terricaulis sp.]
MSGDLAERRKKRALSYFLIAGAMAAVAAVTLGIEYRASRPDAVSGPVLPGISESIASGQRIMITSAEASYRIERAQRGEESVWVMRDRGDYPVLATRLQQLTEGLSGLRYTRRMTNDSSKHARLGVDDPRQGGRGVLVQIEDGRGALLVNLILGVEPSGLYVRRPDDDQAWAAEGDLPPLRDIASWLDLRPLSLEPQTLARVEIVPSEGRAYILARDGADQPWRIAAPALDPLSQSVLRAAAERITALGPIDVQPAPAIQGAVVARVRATTFDGVMLDAEIIDADQRRWVKLVARAGAPEQEAAALAINNRAAPWAYGLSAQEVQALAPPLSSLVPGAN